MTKALSSLEIAAKAKPVIITEIAQKIGLRVDEIETHGNYKAKISLKVLDRFAQRPASGKLICVTGMTPTREGDGKTCTSIALTQALGALKKRVILCLREPSLAPIFGFKGGATGGGMAQVVPMQDINLHFTGDFHAVAAAHNFLAAALDNHLYHGNSLGIDEETIRFRRTVDLSDRSLREIVTGGKSTRGRKHKTGFDITAASEVMAALSLSNSIPSLKSKLSRISLALTQDGRFVTAKDLKAVGAMSLLLGDAIKPNLVQTLEGQPVFIHTGPFANVSHGNNSLMATQLALKLAHYVVTESGFATDLGLEKLFDIVCREGKLKPSIVVMVITVKALKSHGRDASNRKGSDAFKEGFANIDRHIRNVAKFGVPVVVAINRFPADSDDEIQIVKEYLASKDIEHAVSEGVRYGSKGSVDLAEKVVKVLSERSSNFKPLYDLQLSTEEKLHRLATELYGARAVDYSEEAKKDLEFIHRLKLDNLPVCVAKTPYSFSDNPELKGAPSGWKLKVRSLRAYTGAGFLVAVCGKLLLMPGLPEKPMFEQMDLGDDGLARGLF